MMSESAVGNMEGSMRPQAHMVAAPSWVSSRKVHSHNISGECAAYKYDIVMQATTSCILWCRDTQD
jgi:hypothetical protein